MITIARVLCPVDQSDASRRALDFGMHLAGWYGAQVRVLEVAAVVLPPLAVPALSPYALSIEGRGAMADALRAFVDPVRANGVETDYAIDEGDVAPCIVRAAREWPADVVVLGTHGRSGFMRLMLGSITEKVLRQAPCPVITVPPHAGDAPASGTRTIMCAVDFSPQATRALEFALSLAQESDARLLLVHVVDWPEGWDRMLPDMRKEREAEAAARLEDVLPVDARTWCTPDVLVATGKPSREILRLAAQHAPDLIVLGVHGRSTVDLALFGSTTHAVIRESRCPVLTVRS